MRQKTRSQQTKNYVVKNGKNKSNDLNKEIVTQQSSSHIIDE